MCSSDLISYHTAIQMSPFEALYEYPPPLLTGIPTEIPISPEVQATLAEKEQMLKILQQNLEKAQRSMKKFADKHRTKRSFVVGDIRPGTKTRNSRAKRVARNSTRLDSSSVSKRAEPSF